MSSLARGQITTMSTPAPQRAQPAHCAGRTLGPLAERTLSHTTRAIKYVFLEGCQNAAAPRATASVDAHEAYKEAISCYPKAKRVPRAAADCWLPLPEQLPLFHALPVHLEKPGKGSGRSLAARKRLPVFQQLCGEADACLESPSHELKELSDAKAPQEGEERLEAAAGIGLFPSRHAKN